MLGKSFPMFFLFLLSYVKLVCHLQVPLTVTPEDQTSLRKQKAPAKRGRKPKPKASPKKKASLKSKPAKAKAKTKSKSSPHKPKTGAIKKTQKAQQPEGDSEVSPREEKPDRKKRSDTGAKRGRPKTTPADGKIYGCSRCRYAALGCTSCRNPDFKPRNRRVNGKDQAEVAEAVPAPEDPPASARRSRKKNADKSIQRPKDGEPVALLPRKSKKTKTQEPQDVD